MGKLNSDFLSKWSRDKGLAGNSKDKRKFVAEKDGKTYLIVEREHKGASGRFRTTSVHVLNEATGELDYVKAADSYELAKLNPSKEITA
jgi:hypothetical protein